MSRSKKYELSVEVLQRETSHLDPLNPGLLARVKDFVKNSDCLETVVFKEFGGTELETDVETISLEWKGDRRLRPARKKMNVFIYKQNRRVAEDSSAEEEEGKEGQSPSASKTYLPSAQLNGLW